MTRTSLWHCDNRGRDLANRNQSHAFARHDPAHHVEGKPAAIRKWIDGHLVPARRLEHPRFRRVETSSSRNHLHAFRLTSSDDIDAEFREWLVEAYRVGDQQHLEREP